jgi:hypothetical protein
MYCHSLWDNGGSGNKLPSTTGERYVRLFHGLRAPFNKGYAQDPDGKESGVAKSSSSALWSLQMLHQMHKQKDPSGKRHVYMDNFYTRHYLAEKVKKLSDQEIRITGTCRLNVVDKVNKVGVKAAIDLLRDKERGSWALVCAFNGANVVRAFNGPNVLAENCGYVVYKDRKDVVFYSNDLADTPKELVVLGNNDDHAIRCVNGLAKLHRWTDDCILHRKVIILEAKFEELKNKGWNDK